MTSGLHKLQYAAPSRPPHSLHPPLPARQTRLILLHHRTVGAECVWDET